MQGLGFRVICESVYWQDCYHFGLPLRVNLVEEREQFSNEIV